MKKNNLILLIIQIILIIIILNTSFIIVKWYINNKENENILKSIHNDTRIERDEEKKDEIDFKKLKEYNSDTVAWLKVENTKIDSPVVKAEDNSYYLKHNYNKEYNVAGWIFADYKNKLDGTDRNIVIYGHNMKDDSMFGTLKNVINKEWYDNEKNEFVTFITENEYVKYKVFSVYQIEEEDFYINTDIKQSEFSDFVNILKKRSLKNFNVDISKDDTILTLSTCANNNKYRIVLHAVKVKDI